MAVIAFRASLPDISRLMSGAVSVIRFPNLSQEGLAWLPGGIVEEV